MQIWHMEPFACGDRRLPHHVFPPKKISPDQLCAITGVQSYKIDVDDTLSMKKRLTLVKTERNVNASDFLTINDSITDLNDKLDELYEPMVKDEDLVLLIVEGICYYDVEPEEDEWIRVQCEKGDLIVIPKGLNHRFTVTPKNFVKVQRFFNKLSDTIQG
ncbi:unnamed protein product, partial [Mesorhabditis belari]|uniref:ARD n=1 Tax=Mesorhabditis belari TaxID=2138241 RepID=A0AAF3EZS6_9BILA